MHRFEQHILSPHVEMVCGLVKQQKVCGRHQHLGQGIPVALTAGQHTEALEYIIPGEHEAAQQGPQRHGIHPRVRPRDVVKHLRFRLKDLVLILGEVICHHVVAKFDRSACGLFQAGEHAKQGRLASTVHPDERNAIAAIDSELDVVQHALGAAVRGRVVLCKPFDLHHGAAAGDGLWEGEVDRCFLFRYLDPLDLFKLLDARLHLLGLGRLVAEAIDKGFQVLDAFTLIFVGAHQLRTALILQRQVLRVVPVVHMHPLVPHLNRLADRLVQEVAIVRDQDERVLIALQVLFEPVT